MSAPRIDCFDALRLFAALAVVVGHSVTHMGASFLWYDGGNGWWFHDGVVAFFVLSGLMVYRSGERCHERGQPWREYYRNRALRIIPAIYIYGVLIVVALVAVGQINSSNVTSVGVVAFIVSTFALIPVYHPAQFSDFGVGVVNGSLWTIPVEVSFYLVLPLVVLLMHRIGFRRGMTVVGVIAAAGLLAYAAGLGLAPEAMAVKLYGVTFLGWFWFFALGIFWSRMWRRTPHHGGIALAGFVLYAAIAVVRYFVEAPGYSAVLTALGAVPLSYSLVWFGNYGPKFLGRLTNRIGDLSFGTYVWHMVVVNFLIYFGARDWPLPGTVKVLVAAAISLALAALSWHLVEKPALARKKFSSAAAIKFEMADADRAAPDIPRRLPQ